MDCYLNEKHHHVVLHRRGIFSTHFAQHEMTDEHEVEIWRKLVVGCAKMIGVFYRYTAGWRVTAREERGQDELHSSRIQALSGLRSG